MSISAIAPEDIRVGIVGAGSIGSVHFQALTQFAKANIVGIVETSPKLKQVYEVEKQIPVYSTLAELHEKQQPNAVVLATPPKVRLDLAKEAYRLGLHQLHEKPLGVDLAQAKAIASLASERPDLVSAVGYCHRFVTAVKRARAMIQAGELGEVIWINVDFVSRAPDIRDHWFLDAKIGGGGSCIGVTCHSIDLFIHLAGAVADVKSFVHHEWADRAETTDIVLLKAKSGILGNLKSSYSSFLDRAAFEIVGTKGTLSFDYSLPEVLVINDEKGRREESVQSAIYRFVHQDQAWIDAISGKPQSLLATFEQGVEVARITEEVYQNA